LPLSAFTNDALTEELPTSKPNRYLFVIMCIFFAVFYNTFKTQNSLKKSVIHLFCVKKEFF